MNSASERLLFGPAGIPLSTPQPSLLKAIQRVKELGLACLEVEMVRGVRLATETARAVHQEAEKLGIALSVHAPYSINFLSPETGKRLSSQEQLLAAARLADLCGARSLVFHAGFYGQNTSMRAIQSLQETLKEVFSRLHQEKNRVGLRVETMGKKSQFGTLEEVLTLCQEVPGLQPCLDFSHLYAREGAANGYRHFVRILTKVEKKLGSRALHNLHLHVSGVQFGLKGEIKHLNLRHSDFLWEELIMALQDMEAAGLVICESPSLESDALMLQNYYLAYREKMKRYSKANES